MTDQRELLLQLYDRLAAAEQHSLLAFAQFLAAGAAPTVSPVTPPAPVEIPAPEPIERPENESIVAGLKRLAKTYPMLDKSEMLSATSDLVATHLMQGTEPSVVIDELESIFADHYRKLKSG